MNKVKQIFVKYQNRKIYDTQNSKYVSLGEIGKFLGQPLIVVDHVTGEDITTETLLGALNLHFKDNLKESENTIHELAYSFLRKV